MSGGDLGNGQCLEISTGAVCPPAAEAVVPKEHVARHEGRVLLPAKIEMGQNIAPQGSECRQGRRVLAAGDVVTPLATAVMASFGVLSIRVVPRPSVGIITTGAELIPPGRPPARGQIRDANGPMLLALASAMRLQRPVHLRATDRLEAIVDTLQRMADRDLVLLCGGVSVGTYDLVPRALTQYGAEIVFHKVRQKPGKPPPLARKDGNSCSVCPATRWLVIWGFSVTWRPRSGAWQARRPWRGRFTASWRKAVGPKGDRTYSAPARAEYAAALRTSWRLDVLPTVSSARHLQQLPRQLLRRGAARQRRACRRPDGRVHLVRRAAHDRGRAALKTKRAAWRVINLSSGRLPIRRVGRGTSPTSRVGYALA